MALLVAMLRDFFLGESDWTLQTEVIGGQGCYGLSVGAFECLRDDWGLIKDLPKDYLVVGDGRIRRFLAREDKALDVF